MASIADYSLFVVFSNPLRIQKNILSSRAVQKQDSADLSSDVERAGAFRFSS